MPLVQIASFREAHFAHAARAMLESAGLEARLADERLIGNNWLSSNGLAGVKLLVHAADTERARALIEAAAVPARENEAAGSDVDGVDDDALCPRCGERAESADDFDRRLRALSLLAVPLPFTIGRYRRQCSACAHSWRAVPPHRGVLWVLADALALLALLVLGLLALPARLVRAARAALQPGSFACWSCGAQFPRGAPECPSCRIALPRTHDYASLVQPGRAYDATCAACHLPYLRSEYLADGRERRCSACSATLPDSA